MVVDFSFLGKWEKLARDKDNRIKSTLICQSFYRSKRTRQETGTNVVGVMVLVVQTADSDIKVQFNSCTAPIIIQV